MKKLFKKLLPLGIILFGLGLGLLIQAQASTTIKGPYTTGGGTTSWYKTVDCTWSYTDLYICSRVNSVKVKNYFCTSGCSSGSDMRCNLYIKGGLAKNTCGGGYCTNNGKKQPNYTKQVLKTKTNPTYCNYISSVNTWSTCSGGVSVATDVNWSTVSGTSCTNIPLTRNCSSIGVCGSRTGSYSWDTTSYPAGSRWCAIGSSPGGITSGSYFPSPGTSTTWKCNGSGGGTPVSCSASRGTKPVVCGDGTCSLGENSTSCPADCEKDPPLCGDGVCEVGESSLNCLVDCPPVDPPLCGDGVCEVGESSLNCLVDCPKPPVNPPQPPSSKVWPGKCGKDAKIYPRDPILQYWPLVYKSDPENRLRSYEVNPLCSSGKPKTLEGELIVRYEDYQSPYSYLNRVGYYPLLPFPSIGEVAQWECVGYAESGNSKLRDVLCSASYELTCGNNVCETGETNLNCSSDCNPTCGNNVCEAKETDVSCPSDCATPDPVCGDSTCESDRGENFLNCRSDCPYSFREI